LPLYWLILTAFYLDKHYGNYQFSALTYTLLHGFSDVHNLDGISQAWSLSVEMTIYLLAPLLYYLQKKHVIWLLLALGMLYVAFWGIGVIWQQVDKNPQRFFRPNLFLLTGTFTGRSTDFLAGIILAKAIQSQAKWLHTIPYKTIIGFLTMFLLMFIMGWLEPDIYHHGYDTTIGMLVSKTLLPASMMLLLAGLIFERTLVQKLLGSKALVLLGNASFAFYLIHIGYINLRLKTWYVLPDRNFILLWLIAIVLYQIFEMPIYNIFRKLLHSKITK
jgi:peptidoglycan/LPS O-acetylase OafA/YrhL